jgi:F0F1-type ATP synthase assembly protein I
MENQQEEKKLNTDLLFYLIGAVFGGLTGAYCAESFWGLFGGIVFGLFFGMFFLNALVKGRSGKTPA